MDTSPILRVMKDRIDSSFKKRKVLIIIGARQVGKTSLIYHTLNQSKLPYIVWNGDEPDIRNWLPTASSVELRSRIGNHQIVFIDEGQRIKNIGIILKLIHDNIPDVKVIASGSSAFELQNKSNEPLTGRKIEMFLYPISYEEMVKSHGILAEKRALHDRLLYGSYPEIIANPDDRIENLKQLTDSYLFKDIFALGSVNKPMILEKLLRALALQIGSEVNPNELSTTVGADRGTIDRYIELLEKTYVIFPLHSLYKNQRTEIKKGRKIYFWDNGVRNAIINNLTPVENRTDIGMLWENYIISERRKWLMYHEPSVKTYFWRTVQQQEVDFVEEINGELRAYEFKWNPKAKARLSTTFSSNYPVKEFKVIHPDNMEQILLESI